MKLNQPIGLALGLLLLTTSTAHAQTVTCRTFARETVCETKQPYTFSSPGADIADSLDKLMKERKTEARQDLLDKYAREEQVLRMELEAELHLARMAALKAKAAPGVAAQVVATPPTSPVVLSPYQIWAATQPGSITPATDVYGEDTLATPAALTPAQIVAAERAAIRKRLGLAPITD